MSRPSANDIYELLKSAVLKPNLTIEAIAKLLFQYRDGNLPVKQSTADLNKALDEIGVQGKGSRGTRAELCICFVHMKMWNCHEVPLGVVELCKRYDLDRFDVERDPYFHKYCYYLCVVLDIVEPDKHREFLIQDVLIPLSGAKGIKYSTGGDTESARTMIRYKAFEIESRLLRPKTVDMMIASGSPLLRGVYNNSYQVTLDNHVRCTFNEYVSNHVLETSTLSAGQKRCRLMNFIAVDTVHVVDIDQVATKKICQEKAVQVPLTTVKNHHYDPSATVVSYDSCVTFDPHCDESQHCKNISVSNVNWENDFCADWVGLQNVLIPEECSQTS